MQQEPNGVEMIDDEDIAALADKINEAFPDEEEAAEVVAEAVVTEDVVAEDVSAEEAGIEDVVTEEVVGEEVVAEEAADVVTEAGEPVVTDVDHLRLIEALLFASAEPLTVNAIRERMPADADVGGLLMELQKTYEGRGVSLLKMEGHWAFRTSADLADALSMKKDVQRKLSKAAMETLAIVAYHQPVTRPEIENIRGVAISNGTLDVLMECGWVKPGRRRDTPGRPLTWVTSSAFLDHFGLSALTDLPGMDELKSSGLLDARPAIDVTTGSLFGAEDEMLAEDLNDSDIDDEEDDDAYDASNASSEDEVASVSEDDEASEEGASDEEASDEEGSDEDDSENEDLDEMSSDEESDDGEDYEEEASDDDDSDDEDEDDGEAWDNLDASNDDDDEASDDDSDEEVA